MALVVSGTRDRSPEASLINRNLDGAWLLFFEGAGTPPPSTFYMAKWLVFEGGTYLVRGVANKNATLKIDDEEVGTFNYTTKNNDEFSYIIEIPRGARKIDIEVSRGTLLPANSFVALSFYRGSSRTPEIVTEPVDWEVSEFGEPELGPPPPDNPDMSLPVWLLRANWSSEVRETLEWLTDVMESESGAEQRRSIRSMPRRYIEASFAGATSDRNILDNALAGIGRREGLLPIFWELHTLKSPLSAGSTSIVGLFEDRYEWQAGRIAVVFDPIAPMDYELLSIANVTQGEVVLTDPAIYDWPTGSEVYPLAKAKLREAVTVSTPTAAVSTTKIRWHVNQPFEMAPSWLDMPINDRTGLPIWLNDDRDWAGSAQYVSNHNVFVHDNESGVTQEVDVSGQMDQTIRVTLHLRGAKDHREFMQLMFAMRGQLNTFHMPNRYQEILPMSGIKENDGGFAVKPSGYTAYNVIRNETRRWVLIELYNGEYILTRSVASRITKGVEYIQTEQTYGDLDQSQVKGITWMPISRLATDTVEIRHLTNIQGVSTVTLSIKGFHDRRVDLGTY